VVAAAEPGVAVGCCEQGVDFVVGEERHELALDAFGWDGEHPLDQRGVLGVAQRGVAEQRVNGSEAVVAGAHAVETFTLEVIEEGADRDGVEVLDGEFRGGLARLALGEAEQQPEGVAIGGDGVRAGPTLRDQALGEEALHDRGERAHGRAPVSAASKRAATSVSSSGAADRYQ
jgi:hypothetical protein